MAEEQKIKVETELTSEQQLMEDGMKLFDDATKEVREKTRKNVLEKMEKRGEEKQVKETKEFNEKRKAEQEKTKRSEHVERVPKSKVKIKVIKKDENGNVLDDDGDIIPEVVYDHEVDKKKSEAKPKLKEAESVDEASENELADKNKNDVENKEFKEKIQKDEDAKNEKLRSRVEDLLKTDPDMAARLRNETLNSETGENSYDEAELKDKILMILGEISNEARKAYAKKDYDMSKKMGGVKRFFGKTFKLDSFENELDGYKDSYEKSIEKYKDAILEFGEADLNDAKKGGELEIMLRDFQISEHLRMRSDRLDVAAEENPKMEKFKNFFLGTVNSYRKFRGLPSEKISKLTGSKWAGLGLGGVVTAGALRGVGMASGVGIPLRVLSAAVATVGYKQLLESRAENKRVKKNEEEIQKTLKDMEGADKFLGPVVMNRILDEKIEDIHDRIQNEKYYKKWRTVMAGGAAVGTFFVGSWAGEKIAGWFDDGDTEKVGDAIMSEKVTEKVQGSAERSAIQSDSDTSIYESEKSVSESVAKSEYLKEDVKVVEQKMDVIAEMDNSTLQRFAGIEISESNIGILAVKEGSSLEGSLIAFFKENHAKLTEGKMGWDLNKYENLEDWAGKRAHLIAQEFADKHPEEFPEGAPSLIHEGAEIKINLNNPADIQIEGIEDEEGLGYLKKDVDFLDDSSKQVPTEQEAVMQAEELKFKAGISGDKIEPDESFQDQKVKTEQVAEVQESGSVDTVENESAIKQEVKNGGVGATKAELGIANGLGLSPREYSAINDTLATDFAQSDGDSEIENLFKNLKDGGVDLQEKTVNEVLRDLGVENLSEGSNESDMSAKEYAEYFGKVIEGETAEINKILFNGNAEVWKELRGQPAANISDEPFGEAYKEVSKRLSLDVKPGEKAESWVARAVKYSYEQGRLPEIKKYLTSLARRP